MPWPCAARPRQPVARISSRPNGQRHSPTIVGRPRCQRRGNRRRRDGRARCYSRRHAPGRRWRASHRRRQSARARQGRQFLRRLAPPLHRSLRCARQHAVRAGPYPPRRCLGYPQSPALAARRFGRQSTITRRSGDPSLATRPTRPSVRRLAQGQGAILGAVLSWT